MRWPFRSPLSPPYTLRFLISTAVNSSERWNTAMRGPSIQEDFPKGPPPAEPSAWFWITYLAVALCGLSLVFGWFR